MPEPILALDDLTMRYHTRRGSVAAVEEVSFSLPEGASLGLVGESGCGKTSVAMSIMKLLPDNAEVVKGSIRIQGRNLVPLSEDEMRHVRWREISMIFQAAMNAWNPVLTVGDQIVEAIQAHEPRVTDDEARARVGELFEMVGLDRSRINQYPHEYSGGMKQRAVIAMALASRPRLVIADEPTTALDVIVQDRILKEIDRVRRELHMSMIYISHDIAVIAEVSDLVGVMYAGRLVEVGPGQAVFHRPIHPYTDGLMQAFPSIRGEKRELRSIPGEPPNLLEPPAGCPFHPRCPLATDRCRAEVPGLVEYEPQHRAACWHPIGFE
ncbi:ABC transporter ATP-binding protein [Limnochorda pilosa]|uniref:Peptide ABC transporter ATPase n=1 Tax=Limnochorda pilosa TaxID=1555112 RepID=A0A0K2SHR3_LIMPI|nr:ABC transporter ATP-binding protein [Limnochorda pilosa]BAS26577.1 peptide ABC transporter ATPase [Limnochorda pilosa]